MKIAQQLKEKNIAEYLIYMWQVEDLLRANGCDIDRIRQNIILRYPEEERPALEEWYGNLADMMRAEGVTEKGHLQFTITSIRLSFTNPCTDCSSQMSNSCTSVKK